MRAMYHIDKGVRHYFRLSDHRRNSNWQSICAKKKKMEHLSYEGADVLALKPAAKKIYKKNTAAICWVGLS